MRYIIHLVAVALTLSVFLVGCDKDDVKPDPEPGKIVKEVVTSPALQGNLLNDSYVRTLSVWLPRNYERDDRSYPVLYLLHGMPLGENSYMSKDGWDSFAQRFVGTYFTASADFPPDGFESWMNSIMDAPDVDEMIIVTPDATSSYGLTMYTNSPLHGDYEEFIAEDVVGHIDRNYRTIKNRESRYIAGHCQAGYGSIRIAMKHPEVFGKVIALSPFIWTPDLFAATADALYNENPEGLAGPDPNKFMTSALYGFAAAWSPNVGLNAPPYSVDLPFDFETGEPIPAIVAKWEAQNLFGLLPQYGSALAGLSLFYFDCGNHDELSTNLTNAAYDQALTQAGIEHTFELYDGTHVDHIYARLENVLRLLSEHN